MQTDGIENLESHLHTSTGNCNCWVVIQIYIDCCTKAAIVLPTTVESASQVGGSCRRQEQFRPAQKMFAAFLKLLDASMPRYPCDWACACDCVVMQRHEQLHSISEIVFVACCPMSDSPFSPAYAPDEGTHPVTVSCSHKYCTLPLRAEMISTSLLPSTQGAPVEALDMMELCRNHQKRTLSGGADSYHWRHAIAGQV
jgi:hypothetical protein